MTDRASLDRLARELPLERLPDLIADLERAKATAWARLVAPGPCPTAAPEPLVCADELARLIDRPAWSVRDMARRGMIPVVRVGRLLKFRPSAVLAALENEAGTTIANPVRAKKGRPDKGQCPSSVQPAGEPVEERQ
jgi:hypothetical protein